MTKKKNFASRTTAFIIAMLLMLFVLPTEMYNVLAVTANVTVTDVVLNVNNAPLDGQTLSNNDNVDFSFKWSLNKTSDDPFTNPITLQFDFEGMALENVYEGDLLNSLGNVIGTYSITNGDTIQFNLSESMLSESEITGECNFNGKVKFDVGDVSDDNQIDMIVKYSTIPKPFINQKVPVNLEGVLTMNKVSSGNIYMENGVYYQDYTITINAGGTGASIINQIIDTPGELLGDTLDATKGITVTTTGNVIGINDTYNSFSDISDVTMELGSQIVLSYRMAISEDIYTTPSGELWKFNNTAKTIYNNTEETSSQAAPRPVWSTVSKTGSGPDEDGYITWTLTIYNDGFTGDTAADKLICSSITDVLTGYHQFVSSAPTLDDIINPANNPNEWDTKTYVYTYQTKVTEENTTADRSYTNTVTVTLDGVDRTVSDTVTVAGSNPVTKSATDTSIDNENKMGWSVTYTVPSNTTALTIKDVPTATTGKSHSIDANSVAVTVNGAESTEFTLSGNDIIFNQSVLTAGNVIVITYDTIAAGDFTTEGTFTNKATAVYTQNDEEIEKDSNDASYTWDVINAVTKSDCYQDYLGANKLAWQIKIDLNEITNAGHTLQAGDIITLDDVLTRTNPVNSTAPMPTFTSVYYGEANDAGLVDECLEHLSINNTKDKFTFTVTQEMIDGGLEWFTFRYRMDFNSIDDIIAANYLNTVTATYTPVGESDIPAGTASKETYITPSSDKILNKFPEYQQGAVMPYKIIVNESELDLSTEDTVTLTDEFCDLLYFIPSSLVVTDGKTGTPLDESLWKYKYDTETNVLTIELPDNKHCIITYKAGIDVDLNTTDTAALTNNASLEYKTGTPFNKNHSWTATLLKGSATVTYNSGSLVVNKSDMASEDNKQLIDGATFRLVPGYFDTNGLFTPYTDKVLHPTSEKEINYSTGNDTIQNLELEGILYQMTEIAAPSGYKIDPSPRYVVIKRPGDTDPVIPNNINNYNIEYFVTGSTIMIENEPVDSDEVRYPVEFKKVESVNKTALAGATLTLYDSSNVLIDTWETTTANYTVTNLLPGTYTLVETEAPTGYTIANPITFVISDSGEISIDGNAVANGVITMEDEPSDELTYAIKFQKFIKDTETVLAGAKLQLKNITTGTVVKEWESTTEAYEIELAAGTYILSETLPPVGYKTAADISFTITDDGTITRTDNETVTDRTIVMVDALETIDINGTKTWNDSDNQDGKRPESITVRLLADDNEVFNKTVTEDDNWEYTFSSLPKYNDKGVEIVYTITEDTVEGYDTTITGYNITNTYEPETTSVNVEKEWDDEDDQDGKRPDAVTIKLLADSEEVDSITLDADNDWKHTFSDLPKYRDGGTEIVYTIEEVSVDDYESEITGNAADGFTVTNSHTPGKTTATIVKVWDDVDNQDGIRPTSLKVTLSNGTEITLTEATDWTATVSDLPMYEDGQKIAYTWTEDELPDDYTLESNVTNGTITTITNKHIPEETQVSITKVWDDENNQDGKRPQSITVKLLADGEEKESFVLSESNGWYKNVENLPKNKAGTAIVYTWEEIEIEGYTSSDSAEGTHTVLTNTHEPELIDITVEKEWDDEDDQDGKRPEDITVNLLANGQQVESKIISEADGWTYTFTDLPKYRAGSEIVYTVSENEVEDYTANVDGFKITNIYTPETTEVTVTKTWNDADNQDGKRPKSITVRLLADNAEIASKTVTAEDNWGCTFSALPKYRDGGVEIEYTITEDAVDEYDTTIEGYSITNTHEPELIDITVEKEWDDEDDQDGKRPEEITVNLLANGQQVDSKDISEADGWTYTFTDLPKYSAGTEIVYTVSENEVEDYTANVDGFKITNTHEPETVSVSGSKTWVDDNNRDRLRPASITVNLLADNIKIDSMEVAEADGWTYSFDNLPKYKNGTEIVYTVSENEVANYTTEIDGYSITNTYEPVKISLTGTKSWDNNGYTNVARPESITVNLYADGSFVTSATATEQTNWQYTFNDLYKFESGEEIEYTVSEDIVSDFTPTYNGMNITNKYTPDLTSIQVVKDWVDDNDRDGKRPESVTVHLFADGNEVGTATLSKDNNWTYIFTGLDKSNGNSEIVYTVTEDAVQGYTTTIDGYNITNSYTPAKTSITVSKTWEDGNNRDGKRPSSIVVNLLANGTKVASKTVKATDNWACTFDNLYVNENGQPINYTVTEEPVDGYTTEINDYSIINRYAPETVTVRGTKSWADNNDAKGKRPASITVRLLANDSEVDSKTITETDSWTYTFADLPKYENGTEIVYTIKEDAVADYTTIINGYDITNTLITVAEPAETVDISVTKTWNDNSNAAGVRPSTLEITLKRDGTAIRTMSADWVKDGNKWTYTFTDLPKYPEGSTTAYVYTVEEENLSAIGYTSSSASTQYNFNFVNTYTDNSFNDPIVPDVPTNPTPPTPPVTPYPPYVTPVKPFVPEKPEDVSSGSGTKAEAEMIGTIDTTSYSFIAILLALSIGGIAFARRKQK